MGKINIRMVLQSADIKIQYGIIESLGLTIQIKNKNV